MFFLSRKVFSFYVETRENDEQLAWKKNEMAWAERQFISIMKENKGYQLKVAVLLIRNAVTVFTYAETQIIIIFTPCRR